VTGRVAFHRGMKTNLILASLIAASFSTAGAEPTPPTPPGPPPPPSPTRLMQTCEEKGVPLFEIDHRVEPRLEDVVMETSELVLYPSGAWSYTSHDGNGKTTHHAAGCLRHQVLETIEHDLKEATWTVKTNAAKCMVASLGYVEYSSRGKVVWTQRTCQLEYLDETSRRSLDEIEKILVNVSAVHNPPCCKK
jgi:hypothetical protein